jgi:hypothetical protein
MDIGAINQTQMEANARFMMVYGGVPWFSMLSHIFFWSFWCIDQPHLCMLKAPHRLLQDVWEAATAKAALRRDGLFASEANLQRCPGNPFERNDKNVLEIAV